MNLSEIKVLYLVYLKTGYIPILSRLKVENPSRREILAALYVVNMLPYSGKRVLLELDEYSKWKDSVEYEDTKKDTKNKSN